MSVADVFAALADDTRRGLYEQLLEHTEGLTATQLAGHATVTRQAIVRHLQILERSQLAEGRREGREVRYYANASVTQHASDWLIERTAAWSRRVSELERRARRGQST